MASLYLASSVICTRYAGALVDLAEKEKVVDKVQKDLESLGAVIAASGDLSDVILSPLVSSAQQGAIVLELADKIKAQKLTKNFLGVLTQNRRVGALLGVAKAYDKIVAERSGLVDVCVQTAEALGEEQSKAVKEKIEKAIKASVRMEEEVSPDIMGGMVVTIGSYMIDDSVRRKIERLGMALKSGVYQDGSVSNEKEVG